MKNNPRIKTSRRIENRTPIPRMEYCRRFDVIVSSVFNV